MHIPLTSEGVVGSSSDRDYLWALQGSLDNSIQTEELVMDENLRIGKGIKRPIFKSLNSLDRNANPSEIVKRRYEEINGKRVEIKTIENANMNRGFPVQGKKIVGLDIVDEEYKFENSAEFERLKAEFGGKEGIIYKTPTEALAKINRKYKAKDQGYILDVEETLKNAGISRERSGYQTIRSSLEKEAEDEKIQDELRKKFAETELAGED